MVNEKQNTSSSCCNREKNKKYIMNPRLVGAFYVKNVNYAKNTTFYRIGLSKISVYLIHN